MVNQVSLFEVFDGFVLSKRASGKSPNTLISYKNTRKKLQLYFQDRDPVFADLKRADWVAFLAWLQDDYVSSSGGVAPREPTPLSPKSVYNLYTDLSALYTWATSPGIALVSEHVIHTIECPEFEPPDIQAYTQQEVEAMLKACDHTTTWKTRETQTKRPTAQRDRAAIMLLTSTGIRAEELCNIKLKDVDLTRRSILVAGKGRGRDKKQRTVFFGKRTAQALWLYTTNRLSDKDPEARLFTVGPTDDPRPLRKDILRRILIRIGDRAGVKNVTTHRFRHTFAINYIRNGGDPFTLQAQLGHTSLEIVRRYTRIAETDCENAHITADPVDNWRL